MKKQRSVPRIEDNTEALRTNSKEETKSLAINTQWQQSDRQLSGKATKQNKFCLHAPTTVPSSS